MQKLIERIKQEYPMMQVVEDAANGSGSVKFVKYGSTDMAVMVAIKSGDVLEIYDHEGLMVDELPLHPEEERAMEELNEKELAKFIELRMQRFELYTQEEQKAYSQGVEDAFSTIKVLFTSKELTK